MHAYNTPEKEKDMQSFRKILLTTLFVCSVLPSLVGIAYAYGIILEGDTGASLVAEMMTIQNLFVVNLITAVISIMVIHVQKKQKK